MKLLHLKLYNKTYIILITLLFLIAPLFSSGQNKEALQYLKQELVKQRNDLLQKARELQTRIDSIDIILQYKNSNKNPATYLIKSNNKQNKTHNSFQYNNTIRKKRQISNYRRYYRGPRGGCYYINSNGNKSYVDRSLCN